MDYPYSNLQTFPFSKAIIDCETRNGHTQWTYDEIVAVWNEWTQAAKDYWFAYQTLFADLLAKNLIWEDYNKLEAINTDVAKMLDAWYESEEKTPRSYKPRMTYGNASEFAITRWEKEVKAFRKWTTKLNKAIEQVAAMQAATDDDWRKG